MTQHHRLPSITLSDVAQKAGVSRSTASRALNNSPRISPSTTKRVFEVAKSMGFVKNAQGRALAVGRSETIAILITEPLDEFFEDPTYGAFLRGISERLSQTSYLPILMQASSRFERERVQHHLEHKTVDAVIDISPYKGMELLDFMKDLRIPVVLCGQLENDPYSGVFSNIYSNDVEGAELAAQAMHNRGRKRIAAILGPKNNPAVPDRLQGYRNIFTTELPDTRLTFTGWDEASGFQAMKQLWESDKYIDGILAGSDRLAAGALAFLNLQGISVPRDISIIGYDDHPIASQTSPSLTTVRQPLREEGRLAAETAINMVNGQSPITRILHMQLVSRDSL